MKTISLLLCGAPLAWAAALNSALLSGRDDDNSSSSSLDASKGGKSFSLGQVQNADYKGGDAPMEMLKAHTKYVESLPPWLQRAVDKNPDMKAKFKIYLQDMGETGTVSASPPPFYDIQYVVPVDIGTPPQRTMLNLDTGSSDLWTFTTDTYEPFVDEQILYDPHSSSTSQELEGESWSVMYGDGAGASGIVYKDKVQLGETSFDEQAVQSAVHVSYAIAQDSFSSGILGMAFGEANTVRPTQQKTYLENVQDDLEQPLFTVNLQKGKPGNYNFGYIDESEHTTEISYVPIEEGTPFWKVPMSGYQVGSNRPFTQYPWSGVVDTGTTLLLVPDAIIKDYYSTIPGAHFDPYLGMMVFPCKVVAPDFTFGFDGYRGTVPGHYVNYGQATQSDCYGGIQSSEGIGMAIIGDVLLKAQFVVFDIGNRTVGFAGKQTVPKGPVNGMAMFGH